MRFFPGEKLFRLIFLFENFIQSFLCEIGFLSADLAAQGGGELPELGFRQTDNHGAAEVRSQLGRCREGRQRGYGGQLPLFVGQEIAVEDVTEEMRFQIPVDIRRKFEKRTFDRMSDDGCLRGRPPFKDAAVLGNRTFFPAGCIGNSLGPALIQQIHEH